MTAQTPHPIEPEDIKAGQVVEGVQVVDGAQWTVRMRVAERSAACLWSTEGGGLVGMVGMAWTLIEDVPDPDAELIEAIVQALRTTPLTCSEEEDARAALAAIRETHDITPRAES